MLADRYESDDSENGGGQSVLPNHGLFAPSCPVVYNSSMDKFRDERGPAYYRVVVIHDDGKRDVRVRNVSRRFAEAVARAISDTTTVSIERQDGFEFGEVEE